MAKKDKKVNDPSRGYTIRDDSGFTRDGFARANALCTRCQLWYNTENETQYDYHEHHQGR